MIRDHILTTRADITIKDSWIMAGNNPKFSAMAIYKAMSGPSNAHEIFQKVWKTSCRLRHKIFFWLLLHDRLSTRNMIQRRSMHLDDYNCALCADSIVETSTHLFWDCQFASYCWYGITPAKHRGTSTYDEVLFILRELPKDIAMEVVIMGCWSI